MAQISSNFISDLDESIKTNRGIKVLTYELNEATEAKLDVIIERILTKFNRADLKPTVYTCIKELVVNASKANFKHLYFVKHNYDMNDEVVYQEKSAEFKKYIVQNGIDEIAELSRQKHVDVNILFLYNELGLRVKITNPTVITKEDDKRIRNRLKVGSQYDDIAMFYIEQGDNLEGAGIGIALIQILLRGEKIDHKSFTLWTDDNGITTAKLDFPFSGNTLPGARDRSHRGIQPEKDGE